MASADHFSRLALALTLLPVLVTGGCATADRPSATVQAGRALFETAFNPEHYFAGDLRPSSEDQLMLTAAASSRDDYVPDYSLAVAYQCRTRVNNRYECRYAARMLRVRGPGLPLLEALMRAGTQTERNAALDRANLDWLEADILDCDRGLFAMDMLRMAD